MIDERVRAVVPLSGYTLAFGSNGMESVDVPVMFMAGSGAMAASAVWDVEAPYDALNTGHKAKVVFDNGEYLFFFSSCADSPSIVELGFPMFCTDPVWDTDRAHDLINHFATAFLLAELKGDSAAATALAPENVDFPGIEYESAGYGAAATTALNDDTTAKIDAIVQAAMTDYPTPGFEMCIVKDDQVVYNKGFGLANVASDRPMTPQSVSTQASISKSLTAMAVMQLVEQGKVDLDTPVTAYLPYFTMADPRYEEITVRMLLSHLSGVPDTPYPWNVPLDPAIDPLEQAVRSLSDQQLISAPGEAWNYSNWGYSVLGDIIAKVSGEPFASYMQQHLLEPMGMVNSTFVMDEVDPDLYVTGYISAEDGSAAAMEHFVDPRDVPNSGLWSNCEDMIKWARFMLNKGELNGTRILQPESIDAMWTSEAGTFWPDVVGPWYGPYVGEYGLGWYVGEKAGHRLAGHAGAGDGVNTHIQFAPDNGLAVIAIDNWLKPDPDWYPAGFAAFDVMDLLLGLQPEEEPAATLDDATVAKIETLVEEIMAGGQVPGAAVGIVKDGELVYANGFGVTELGNDEPVTPDSVFAMGSVGKTPTAMAIMQLVEEGKIELDAPVTQYLPDFTLTDPDLSGVTIRRLLSHTSGMPDPIDWLAEYEDPNLRSDKAALNDYVHSLGDQSLTFQPGEDWSYSNTGFDVLGDVVATVSGQSFEGYLQANVLTPLGMASSSYLLNEVDPAKLAAPHMYDEDGNAKTLDFYPYTRAHAPSGALYSNVHDMARFAMANMNQGELDATRVLPTAAYDEMWTPQAASPWAENFGPQVTNYGLGWWVGEFNGHRIIGNYGTEFGFQSHLALFPDDGMAVIALVNLFDPEAGTFYAYDIGNGIADILLDGTTESATQPPTTALDDITVAKIEGLLNDQMQPNDVPGYAMCVAKDGSEVYSKGFGVTELGGDQPVTPQSVFAIRSTTKSFTAVALMQLVEQGKIDLDAPVTQYLPYFTMADPRYKDITVRMLASHTSGLTDEVVMATLPEGETPATADAAIEWYTRSLSDDTLTAAPGETWQYADTNFILVGDIIEKVSGEPYNDYMSKHVLEPLGMTHSTFDAAAIPAGALVGEHVTTPEGVVEATALSDFSGFERPAAGIYSTCDDMARWMQMNLNRGELDGVRILEPESYDLLWTPVAATGYDEFFGPWAGQYGLGWSIGENGGHFLTSHPGGAEGQNIHFQLAPDDNLGVVVLANWGTESIAHPAWVAAADVTYALLGIGQ